MDTRERRAAHRRSATGGGYGTAYGAETDLAELRERSARMVPRWTHGPVGTRRVPDPAAIRVVTVPAGSLRLVAGLSEYGTASGA